MVKGDMNVALRSQNSNLAYGELQIYIHLAVNPPAGGMV
jgi:hypothetical protein